MTDIDQATLQSLAGKISSLDLTEAEQNALDQVLDRATSFQPEVAGFSSYKYNGLESGADLDPVSFKLGRGLGLFGAGIGGVGTGDFRPPPP